MDLTVNQAGYALRRFESYPLQFCLLASLLRFLKLYLHGRRRKLGRLNYRGS